jgi:hypothetical protein
MLDLQGNLHCVLPQYMYHYRRDSDKPMLCYLYKGC